MNMNVDLDKDFIGYCLNNRRTSMTTLTTSITQNIVAELISDMELTEAVAFTTDLLKELIFLILNNPEIEKEEKDEFLGELSLQLQEANIDLGLDKIEKIEKKDNEHKSAMFG
jgi:hypothetical protein